MKIITGKHKKDKDTKDKIKIENSDVWDMYTTLATVILPMLKKFKDTTISCPFNSTMEEWYSTLDEMIWSFEQLQPDVDDVSNYSLDNTYYKRIDTGLLLFAKHYRNLWS